MRLPEFTQLLVESGLVDSTVWVYELLLELYSWYSSTLFVVSLTSMSQLQTHVGGNFRVCSWWHIDTVITSPFQVLAWRSEVHVCWGLAQRAEIIPCASLELLHSSGYHCCIFIWFCCILYRYHSCIIIGGQVPVLFHCICICIPILGHSYIWLRLCIPLFRPFCILRLNLYPM